MEKFIMTDIGLQNLRAAIIQRMAEDGLASKRYLYLWDCGYIKLSKAEEQLYRRRHVDAIDFFRSEWFVLLSNGIDGDTALKGLEDYYPEWYREQNKKKTGKKRTSKKKEAA